MNPLHRATAVRYALLMREYVPRQAPSLDNFRAVNSFRKDRETCSSAKTIPYASISRGIHCAFAREHGYAKEKLVTRNKSIVDTRYLLFEPACHARLRHRRDRGQLCRSIALDVN
jgi:hypothetical protein